MGHKPMNELADDIAQYKDKIAIPGTYVHYKDATKTYTVRKLVIIEATEEVGVEYQANYGPHLTFVRPIKEWLEDVTVDGVTLPRFKLA
jgi:hypothetical protein